MRNRLPALAAPIGLVAVLLAGPAARGEPGPAAFDPATLTPYFERGPAQAAMARFVAGDHQAAAALFGAYAEAHPQAADRPQAQFLQAVALMRLEQWERAAALFRALDTSYPLLAPYHAIYAARCALGAKHPDLALIDISRVPAGNVLEGEALMVRADALVALGRVAPASHIYESYLKQFPGGVRAHAARYRLALLLERLGRPAAEIAPLYRRVWAEAVTDPMAEDAAARLAALVKALPAAKRALLSASAEDLVKRGTRLADRNRNQEAEKAFEAALKARGVGAALECEARFGRAQAAFKQKPRGRSAPLFDAALAPCERAKDLDRHAKALYQGGRAHVSAGDWKKGLALFAALEQRHPGHAYADDARLRRAEVLADNGQDAEAAKLLQTLPDTYPRGDMVGEALWRLAWRAWKAKDVAGVLRWTDENLKRLKHEDVWYAEGRALYWNGRARERQGDAAGAQSGYEQAIRQYPLSYYALLSFQRLQKLAPPRAAQLQRELTAAAAPAGGLPAASVPASWSFTPRPLYRDPAFLRAVELMRLRLGTEGQRELAHLGVKAPTRKGAAPPASKEAEELAWVSALLLDRSGQWALSHSVARHHLAHFKLEYPRGPARLRWEIAYPKAYPAIMPPSASAGGIPSALLWAIAREESAFNPTIESHAHAVGLTQLLVKTAQRFAPPGLKVTRERLHDPALNAQIGAQFLGFLWRLWAQNPGLVIASYNAGEAAVGRWMKERGGWSIDEFIEAIPYDETRNYTKRVMASYFTYAWLDGAKVPDVPLR
ncbi:MAG TPA: transglycosylase SLT domain-containing protein [Polyangia bacterium]|jgi:soluble lytic murein transglycosylase